MFMLEIIWYSLSKMESGQRFLNQDVQCMVKQDLDFNNFHGDLSYVVRFLFHISMFVYNFVLDITYDNESVFLPCDLSSFNKAVFCNYCLLSYWQVLVDRSIIYTNIKEEILYNLFMS